MEGWLGLLKQNTQQMICCGQPDRAKHPASSSSVIISRLEFGWTLHCCCSALFDSHTEPCQITILFGQQGPRSPMCGVMRGSVICAYHPVTLSEPACPLTEMLLSSRQSRVCSGGIAHPKHSQRTVFRVWSAASVAGSDTQTWKDEYSSLQDRKVCAPARRSQL